jgi:hypothetical protein
MLRMTQSKVVTSAKNGGKTIEEFKRSQILLVNYKP